MGKYIKLFETHSQYETYINGNEVFLPNVSYCEDNNECHYNPIPDPRVIATFNVNKTSSEITILYNSVKSGISEMEIDGVVQQSVVSTYQFDTTGEHIVKYTLTDPTTMPYNTKTQFGQTYNYGMFYQTQWLTSVIIPNSVTTFNGAFHNCSSLTSVTLPKNITSINNWAFYECGSITSIIIPNTVTTIGNCAFYGCRYLTNVTIPSGVTSIGDDAFGYVNFTSLTIPSGVTKINDGAFCYCSNLTNVMIPSGVTIIGSRAFENCSSLISVTIEATTPPTLNSYAFSNNATGRKIYVPSASVSAYQSAWSSFASSIEAIPTT